MNPRASWSTSSPAIEPERARGAALGAGVLYREHAPFVAGLVFRAGARRDDVEDLVHEVFLIAHRRGGYVPGPAKPRTWLAEIAVRVLSTYRRTRRRKPTHALGGGAAQLACEAARPDQLVAMRRALRRLERLVVGLDEEHRTTLMLHVLDGVPCGAVSARLGVPIGTVYSRVHGARGRLRAAWEIAGL